LAFRTFAAAAASSVVPSQSGKETHPSSRYTLAGADGISMGRFPDLLHWCHSAHPGSFSPRT
jgi:hypothetical protein